VKASRRARGLKLVATTHQSMTPQGNHQSPHLLLSKTSTLAKIRQGLPFCNHTDVCVVWCWWVVITRDTHARQLLLHGRLTPASTSNAHGHSQPDRRFSFLCRLNCEHLTPLLVPTGIRTVLSIRELQIGFACGSEPLSKLENPVGLLREIFLLGFKSFSSVRVRQTKSTTRNGNRL